MSAIIEARDTEFWQAIQVQEFWQVIQVYFKCWLLSKVFITKPSALTYAYANAEILTVAGANR